MRWHCWSNLTTCLNQAVAQHLEQLPALDKAYDPIYTPKAIPHHPTSYKDISLYITITAHALTSACLAASQSFAPPPPGVMPLLPPSSYAQTDHAGIFPQVRLVLDQE